MVLALVLCVWMCMWMCVFWWSFEWPSCQFTMANWQCVQLEYSRFVLFILPSCITAVLFDSGDTQCIEEKKEREGEKRTTGPVAAGAVSMAHLQLILFFAILIYQCHWAGSEFQQAQFHSGRAAKVKVAKRVITWTTYLFANIRGLNCVRLLVFTRHPQVKLMCHGKRQTDCYVLLLKSLSEGETHTRSHEKTVVVARTVFLPSRRDLWSTSSENSRTQIPLAHSGRLPLGLQETRE